MIQMPVSVISEDQGQRKTNKRRRTSEVAQFARTCAKHYSKMSLACLHETRSTVVVAPDE
jgi:hypothetical protein